MWRPTGGKGLLAVSLLSGAVILAGCGGGSKSSRSTTGATSTQKVKRLEVTLVQTGAAAPTARPFLAWAAELLGWPRTADAAVCQVTANPGTAQAQTVTSSPSGKATIENVPVVTPGNVPVEINCSGVISTLNLPVQGDNTVVSITVQVGANSISVRARNDHVSEPSVSEPSVSEPSLPSQSLKPVS